MDDVMTDSKDFGPGDDKADFSTGDIIPTPDREIFQGLGTVVYHFYDMPNIFTQFVIDIPLHVISDTLTSTITHA